MSGIKKVIKLGGRTLTIETGIIARQADGAVMVDLDGTTVLCTVVGAKEAVAGQDFFPLRVDYQERAYASGRIPGGFFKREGRPSEREILTSRLIDRPVRPLFADGFCNEVQIIATLMSLNSEVEPDIPAIIGTSAALAISGIPFMEPIAASRVGFVDGQYILNPTQKALKNTELDLVVAGTESSVLMVESEASELCEEVMLKAVMFGHQGFQPVITAIKELAAEAGKPKWSFNPPKENTKLTNIIRDKYQTSITEAYNITDKLARYEKLNEIRKNIAEEFVSKEVSVEAPESIITENMVRLTIENIERDLVRGKILSGKPRIDGRSTTDIRPITIETGVLPKTHGSALFTRGETQALVSVTLGTGRDAQLLDNPFGEQKDTFMLHYNFPPFCVGEIGNIGSPKRREIGHGRLARRGIEAVLPDIKDFPYVTRVVSEITESNGSSSMATVCGSSLALMDAGVPLSAPVAGIAMGLIKEGSEYAIVSDILGDEDHLGDMDFKVAGTSKGITALQMDIKINGITEEIMEKALTQALEGRLHILGIMNKAISNPRSDISTLAPRIITFTINPEKIKDVIGKGGTTIRSLVENTDATIDIQENGTVQIASADKEIGDGIRKKIENLVAEVEIDKIYEGTVVKILDFGAFVNILPGRDGLVHVSQIAPYRVQDVASELKEGQSVKVKVLDIDRQGKIKLSIKAALGGDAGG